MILTAAQQHVFWRLWQAACRAQGWTRAAGWSESEITGQRREFLRRCGFESLTQVDRTNGFTRVKNELTLLTRPDLNAARETTDPALNRARVLRHVIRARLLPCLGLFEDAEAYLATICAGFFQRLSAFNRPATLEDLDAHPGPDGKASELDQVMMTLSARVDAKRRRAGMTVHDMRIAADVPCDCARCTRHAAPLPPRQKEYQTAAKQPF
jgi:hypothetical protein